MSTQDFLSNIDWPLLGEQVEWLENYIHYQKKANGLGDKHLKAAMATYGLLMTLQEMAEQELGIETTTDER